MARACPICLSPNCHVTRRRWYDWVAIMLLHSPQRCHTCFHVSVDGTRSNRAALAFPAALPHLLSSLLQLEMDCGFTLTLAAEA